MTDTQKQEFAQALRNNVTDNILPYWMDKMVDPRGGFYGRRDGNDCLDADAPKGAILNGRLLWTFAAAYRVLGDPRYLEMALRARDYILEHFIDHERGGVYWSLNADGTPLDTKKQFYALAFVLYGMAELVRATGDDTALRTAGRLFDVIESRSRDRAKGGYIEALTADWQPIADMRLSDKDDNASKTMNTHLHILEAYTNLLRVWPTDECREAVRNLLEIFFDKILDRRNWHLGLFYDDDWRRVDREISYGHDIEASWLLLEAAQVLGDPDMYRRARELTGKIARAALQGRCWDASMVYERHASGHYDNDKHWWVQAEDMVGQLYLARFHGLENMWNKAQETWAYIDANLVDHVNGEWYWSRRDGHINRTDDKAGFWKCPYHNTRACLEAARLLESAD